MHPGFLHWWKQQQRAYGEHAAQHGAGPSSSCGPGARWGSHRHGHHSHGDPGIDEGGYSTMEDGGGGHFGVRRPLRFMAHKLELTPEQVSELAGLLDALKTERAQAAVDHRRSVGAFADAVAADSFDAKRAEGAADERVKSAERLRQAVVTTLQKTHAMLNPEQRKRLAYLLRSGQLTI